MPKKPQRNAFYYYMVDFKEEQRQKGINYNNLGEVADAAGPLWKEAPKSVKDKYQERVKKEKQKHNILDMKYTTQGISFAEIDRREQEQKDAEERELKDIRNLVKLPNMSDTLLHQDFFIMDVNYYCQVGSLYVICEFTILKFNLADGILNMYHEMFNPGSIPIGYASDAKLACETLGVEMPDPDEDEAHNYMRVLANIMDYLNVQTLGGSQVMPPIFTMPEKVDPIRSFIQEMLKRTAEQDCNSFRIYKLNTLFFTLKNTLKTCDEEGFPAESLALAQLQKDVFKYNPGMACESHSLSDRPIECCMSRAQRWAYTVLDHCCVLAGVDLLPGRHVPRDFDMESIETCKQKMFGSNPKEPVESQSSKSNFDYSWVANPTKFKTEPRIPGSNYASAVESTSGFGRGRGASVAASFDKMKIGK